MHRIVEYAVTFLPIDEVCDDRFVFGVNQTQPTVGSDHLEDITYLAVREHQPISVHREELDARCAAIDEMG